MYWKVIILVILGITKSWVDIIATREHSFVDEILLVTEIEHVLNEEFINFLFALALTTVSRIVAIFECYHW